MSAGPELKLSKVKKLGMLKPMGVFIGIAPVRAALR